MKHETFPFHAADFLSDRFVMQMTYEEVGVYITLLALAWREGGIPQEHSQLARLLKLPEEHFGGLWAAIKFCWRPGRDGLLVNPRLEQERQRQSEWSRKSRQGGLKSAARRQKRKGGSATVGTTVPTNVQPGTAKSPPYPPYVETLCSLLATSIEGNGSKRPVVTQRWRDSAQRLVERDEKPLEEIVELIRWCQQDAFWRSNVLSMPKFREKYDQLRLQRERHRSNGKGEHPADIRVRQLLEEAQA